MPRQRWSRQRTPHVMLVTQTGRFSSSCSAPCSTATYLVHYTCHAHVAVIAHHCTPRHATTALCDTVSRAATLGRCARRWLWSCWMRPIRCCRWALRRSCSACTSCCFRLQLRPASRASRRRLRKRRWEYGLGRVVWAIAVQAAVQAGQDLENTSVDMAWRRGARLYGQAVATALHPDTS